MLVSLGECVAQCVADPLETELVQFVQPCLREAVDGVEPEFLRGWCRRHGSGWTMPEMWLMGLSRLMWPSAVCPATGNR